MRTPLSLENDDTRDAWLFWLAATVILFAGLGLRDPWPADEPRFALVARQMVESGQWLFPMRGDELYPDKPPLFMWLQAAFYAISGQLRIAFLLPSLLAALGTLWLVRDLGRRLWSAQAGTCAAWALLLALQFTWQSKRAQIDPTVTFFITLSVYSLLRHLLRGPDWRFWMLGWFAAGLGVISKGVGVVALLVLLPAAWAQWRGWSGIATMRSAKFWLGPVALLLPLALWLVPMLLAVNASGDPALRAYADNILLKQTAKRYADPWHHHQPFWYFIQVGLTQWLPSVAALPWMFRPWREALRARDARILLPLAWVALVLLFFSLSSGKREVYIMPALPMLCLAMGAYLPGVLAKTWPRRIAFGVALGLAALLAIGGAMVVLGEPGFERKLEDARGIAHGAEPLGAMLLAIGAFGLAAVAWLRARRGAAALAWVLGGLWVGVSLIGYPLLNDASSARGVMVRVGQRIGADAELALVAWKEQNLLMAGRPARTFGFLRPAAEQLRDARAWQAQAPGRRWLLLERAALDECVDRARAINMGISNRREWWLVPAAAQVPACVPVPGERRGADGQPLEDDGVR